MKKVVVSILFLLLVSACSPERNPTHEENNSTDTTNENGNSSAEINPSEDNICYSEYNLTDEECANIGTHLYEVAGFTQGSCVLDASGATSFLEDVNVTVTFSKQDGAATISNPSKEHHYNTVDFTYRKVKENTYSYLHQSDVNKIEYSLVFNQFGFTEKSMDVWCDYEPCDCRFTAEYRLKN